MAERLYWARDFKDLLHLLLGCVVGLEEDW